MLFNSLEFLIFFPIALAGHALLRGQALRWWLVFASYVFYGWAIPWYCLLLFASTVLDFNVGLAMSQTGRPAVKRCLLVASLAGNLGLLAVFKYAGFFATTANDLCAAAGLSWHCSVPQILLPVGISFYTFQTLSYTIDVYRGRMTPTQSFSTFALYVAFFPQLVAGPIERATHLLPQLERKMPRNTDDILAGLSRICWGMFKKVVLADWLAVYVNLVYDDPAACTPASLVLATYAFAFQIYFDFSAYSDIAIGLARTMGINVCENFRWPYTSRNVGEFWRRWHISLSTWLRDYLYFPLGGSRKGAARTMLNVFIVFFLGGLWHGADKKFIVWGLWIGLWVSIYYAYASYTRRKFDPESPLRWRDILGVVFTFQIIAVSWVFFRADSLSVAWCILQRIGGYGQQYPVFFREPMEDVWRTVAIIVLAYAVHVIRRLGLTGQFERIRNPVLVGAFWGVMIVLCLLLLAPIRERFIYFQF